MSPDPVQRSVQPDPRTRDLVRRLEAVRRWTLDLQAAAGDADLQKVHEPTMGPVHWDLGHIAHFEELWLVHGVRSREARERAYDPLYDAEQQPRPTRDQLTLPDRDGALRFLADVRRRTLETLAQLDLDAGDRLVRDGFVHEMVLQHECQHQENMLVTLQMIPGRYHPPNRRPKPTRPDRAAPEGAIGSQERPTGMARVEGGRFRLGADPAPGVYDNESPSHEVEVDAFWIDRAPVTNGDYLRFIRDGGYEREELWDEDGWLLCRALKWKHPKYWQEGPDGSWLRREYDRVEALPLDEPVCHVSWYEADAYARWAGKRLPTEAEWEMAATWDPATGGKRRFPWGDEAWTPERANLDRTLFGTAPVGAYPEGASAVGCHQLLGDTWEWTSSDFAPYPGFQAYPYEEYSVPFFDRGFKVLRGGSWATSHEVARGTFRNWHQPDHRQLFAGFRCASSNPLQEGGA